MGSWCSVPASALCSSGHDLRMMLSSRLLAGSLRKNLQPPFHVNGLPGFPSGETPVAFWVQTRWEHAERSVCPLGTAQMGNAQVGRRTLGSQTPGSRGQNAAGAFACSACVCRLALPQKAHARCGQAAAPTLSQGPSYRTNH